MFEYALPHGGKRRGRTWDRVLLLGTVWILGITWSDASVGDSLWEGRSLLPWKFARKFDSHHNKERQNVLGAAAPNDKRRTVTRPELRRRRASSRQAQRIDSLTRPVVVATPALSSASSFTSPTSNYSVTATPFEIIYESDLGMPTEENFLGAEAATVQHLSAYFHKLYAGSSETTLTDVIAASTAKSGSSPASIEYTVTAIFDPSSAVAPTRASVDGTVETAFDSPAVDDLFLLLDGLPPSSPFSQTWSITYDAHPVETLRAPSQPADIETAADSASVSLLSHAKSSKSNYNMTSSKSSSSKSKSSPGSAAPSIRPTVTPAPQTAVPSPATAPPLLPSASSKSSKSKKSKSPKSSKAVSSKSFYGKGKGLPSKSKESKSKEQIKCPPTVAPTGSATTAPSQVPKNSQSPTPGATSAPVSAAPLPATSGPTAGGSTAAPASGTGAPSPGGSTAAPASGTSSAPTPGGSTTPPATASPAGGGVNVQASPFYIIYDTDLGTPTPEDFDAAADITIQHIEDYLNEFFGTNTISILIDVNSVATGTATNPASIGYEVTAVFDPSSDLIPSQSDIDQAINTAFSDPGFQELFTQLDTLPPSNPMSQTWGLTYQQGALPAPAYPELLVGSGSSFKITHSRRLQSEYNIFGRSKSSKSHPSLRPVSGPGGGSMPPVAAVIVQSSPFNVTYTIEESTTPTEQDTGEAAGVTQQYLADFFMRFFEDSGVSVLTEFDSDEIGSTATPFLTIEYEISGVFAPSSRQIPTQADMDLLVEAAFSDPVVQVLIERLNGLPPQNPFASTTDVTTTAGPSSYHSSSKSMSPNSSKSGKGSGKGSSRTKRPSRGKGGKGKGSSKTNAPSRQPSSKGKGKGGKGSSKYSKAPPSKSPKSSKSKDECLETFERTTEPISVRPTKSPRPSTLSLSPAGPSSAPAPSVPSLQPQSSPSPLTVAPTPQASLPTSSQNPAQSPSTTGPAAPSVVGPTPLAPSATQSPAASPLSSPPVSASPALTPSTTGPAAPSAGPPTPATPSAPSATQAPAAGPSSPSVGPPTPSVGPPTPLTPSASQAPASPSAPSVAPPATSSPALAPSTSAPAAPSVVPPTPVAPSAPSATQAPASAPDVGPPTPATPSAPSVTPAPAAGPSAPSVMPPTPATPSAPSATQAPATGPSAPSVGPPTPATPSAPSATQAPASPSAPSVGPPTPSAPSATQAPASGPSAPSVTPPTPATPSAPSATQAPATGPSAPSVSPPTPATPSAPSATQAPASAPTPSAPSVTQAPATGPSAPSAGPPTPATPSAPSASQAPATRPSAPSVGPPSPLTPSAPSATQAPAPSVSTSPALSPSTVGPAAPSTAQPATPSTGQPASVPTSSIQPAASPAASPSSLSPVQAPSSSLSPNQSPIASPVVSPMAVQPNSSLPPSPPATPTPTPNGSPTTAAPAQVPSSTSPITSTPPVPVTSSPASPAPTSVQQTPTIAPTPGASEITLSSAPTPGVSTAAPTPGITTITTPAPTGVTPAPTPGSCFSPADDPFTPPAGTTVAGTPFNVDYTLTATGAPTQADFDEASTSTCRFLREQLCIFFSTNVELTFEGITCEVTSTGSNPTQIGYQVSAVFSQDSVTVPTQFELDIAMASMFSGSSVDVLISSLQELPASNPFSTTTGAASDFNPVQSTERDPTSPDSPAASSTVWLFVAIGCSLVLGIAIVWARRHSTTSRNRTVGTSRASTSPEDATMEIVFESRRPGASDEVSQLLFGASYCGSRYGPPEAVSTRERIPCEPDGAYLCDDPYFTEPSERLRS